MDTIFALATARGKSGVAIVRLSGSCSWTALQALGVALPAPRKAALRRLTWQGEPLDEALVLIFAEGESFTGEAAAELHLHGSSATVSAVLAALSGQPGLRMAEAGEFTRRALENGRLDLTQVEGLADLIDAETEAQRRQALRVLSGAIGRRAEGWRRDLIRAAALLEATIDFADEEVPQDVFPEVRDLIRSVGGDLRKEIAAVGAAERIRDGYEVAIVGRPNAGKSTLLNRLAGRDAAITSEVAGTTRDVIEVRMDIGGLPVTLLDTAGLRESSDRVEQIGIERALERARLADLRVFLLDGQEVPLLPPEAGDILVAGKADLQDDSGLSVSGLTGIGIDRLVAEVGERVAKMAAGAGLMTRERHRDALRRAIRGLESAEEQIEGESMRAELAAEELRHATLALDSLVGRVDVEDLLGEIFANFCIGK